MTIDKLPKEAALQLILRLKQGRNVIFGASFFSVGREPWIRGSEQVLTDIEHTSDSVVRFIRGDYGVGKTNFAARIFEKALHRGWTGAYIELSEGVMLYEFHQVFSQICDKLYLPEELDYSTGIGIRPNGVIGALESYYKRTRSAMGLGAGADLSTSARADILSRVSSLLRRAQIFGDFATAVRLYFEGRLDGDRDLCRIAEQWFRADPTARVSGSLRPVTKVNGKEHLRSLSALLNGIGYKGMLIIIDELERIMEESRSRRRKSYTILRELIDNVDGENGMKSSCLYAVAPPGQFESANGFIEVDALASRIQAPILGNGHIDVMGAIVDLDSAPLSTAHQLQLAKNIRALHSRARGWDAGASLTDEKLKEIVTEINSKKVLARLRVREICIQIVSALEVAHSHA
jgi:hypothetical protein